MKTRRRNFLKTVATTAAIPWLRGPARLLAWAEQRRPAVQFPANPRERIAVASYPFREFIAGAHDPHATSAKMPLREFAGHVQQKFNIARIEPWSEHFLSTDPTYLDELRSAVVKAGSGFANIAADGEDSFYSPDPTARAKAVAFGKKWIDIAAHIG